MKSIIKNIIKTLCEDGHNAMVEKRKSKHLPIEDISPYEVIYDYIIKEFERIEKENSELRECLKEAADLECTSRGCLSFRDKTCHGTYGCGIVKKWRAALEGRNRAND